MGKYSRSSTNAKTTIGTNSFADCWKYRVLAKIKIVVPRARTIVVMVRAGPAVLIELPIASAVLAPARRLSR